MDYGPGVGDEVTLPRANILLSWGGGGGGGRIKDFYMQLHHAKKIKQRKTPALWASGLEQPLSLSCFLETTSKNVVDCS